MQSVLNRRVKWRWGDRNSPRLRSSAAHSQVPCVIGEYTRLENALFKDLDKRKSKFGDCLSTSKHLSFSWSSTPIHIEALQKIRQKWCRRNTPIARNNWGAGNLRAHGLMGEPPSQSQKRWGGTSSICEPIAPCRAGWHPPFTYPRGRQSWPSAWGRLASAEQVRFTALQSAPCCSRWVMADLKLFKELRCHYRSSYRLAIFWRKLDLYLLKFEDNKKP